jgi:AraC-like DNA-binding protein
MLYSTLHVSALLEAVERAGFVVSARVAEAGLSLDASGRVGAADVDSLLELCLAESNNPALGLAMGEHASLVTLGLSKPPTASRLLTLRVVIETFMARYTVSVDAQSPELSVADDEATLSFPVHGASAAVRRLRAEYGVTLGLLLLRTSGGPFATPRWVSFPHEAPSYIGEYRRLYGAAARFGAERAAIAFSADLLRAPSYPWGRQLVRSSSLRSTLVPASMRVDEYVRKLLASSACGASERPEMTEIAVRLRMTERTLRRRLASTGVSFRELLDEALRERALLLMLDSEHSPESVSEVLGFSQPSAFHRAFRRWTGVTPLQYRNAHRGDEGDCNAERRGEAVQQGALADSC